MIEPLILFVAVPLAVAYALTVVVSYHAVERPVGTPRWDWLWRTAVQTAVVWLAYVRNFLRGLPAYIRAWRYRNGEDVTPAAAPPVASPGPAAVVPRAPAPPLPPAPGPEPPRVPVFTASGIPPDHTLVHARIATFEPENEEALMALYQGEANAAHGYGEAWLAHTEVLLNAVGLDPAFTASAVMLAEAQADMAEMFAMVQARLAQVYALVKEHLAGGGTLPFDGDFLTGDV